MRHYPKNSDLQWMASLHCHRQVSEMVLGKLLCTGDFQKSFWWTDNNAEKHLLGLQYFEYESLLSLKYFSFCCLDLYLQNKNYFNIYLPLRSKDVYIYLTENSFINKYEQKKENSAN